MDVLRNTFGHQSFRTRVQEDAIKMLYIDNEKLKTLKNNCRDYAIMNYSEKNLDLVTRHYD